jgi:hypothetical protein
VQAGRLGKPDVLVHQEAIDLGREMDFELNGKQRAVAAQRREMFRQ